jgi:uncharacterized lipoprotein NlpE involved in copper resistance
MKKIFYVFTTAALVFGLCACGVSDQSANQPADQPVDMHNSEISLDWAGVYTGVIPAASGPGINVTMTLRYDLTYEVQYQYIDRPDDGDFTITGTFRWNEAGSAITLDATNIPPHYSVGEGRLTQLDMEGNPITGALADNYVLIKK